MLVKGPQMSYILKLFDRLDMVGRTWVDVIWAPFVDSSGIFSSLKKLTCVKYEHDIQ